MSIYVEARIHGPLEEVWRLTQTPDLHARWDLRFTDIQYLPRPDETQPQQFLYATRIGFGLGIEGRGESVGQRDADSGERTSALKFWSDDPKSLIREGAGYWRYVPTEDGIRFLTSYDYRVRFGPLGRTFDAIVFRPLLGWATAWSFDRLRLWIEKGIDPLISLQRSLVYCIARWVLAFVWFYHGLVPKLIRHHEDELAPLLQAGVSPPTASWFVCLGGLGEIAFAAAIIFWFHRRWPLVATIAVMLLALVSVTILSPQLLTAAFNPVSLNVLMVALAAIALLSGSDLPSARHCLRRPPETRS